MSHELTLQLVHSMILSHLHYCNARKLSFACLFVKEAYRCVTSCCEIYFWSVSRVLNRGAGTSEGQGGGGGEGQLFQKALLILYVQSLLRSNN